MAFRRGGDTLFGIPQQKKRAHRAHLQARRGAAVLARFAGPKVPPPGDPRSQTRAARPAEPARGPAGPPCATAGFGAALGAAAAPASRGSAPGGILSGATRVGAGRLWPIRSARGPIWASCGARRNAGRGARSYKPRAWAPAAARSRPLSPESPSAGRTRNGSR